MSSDNFSSRSGFLFRKKRVVLRALMRKRKIPALEQRRANALLLLDGGMQADEVAQVLFLDLCTVRQWFRNFRRQSTESVKLSDYNQREGHLSASEEQAVIARFKDNPPRDVSEVRCYLRKTYETVYSRPGAIALMKRLGFVYKKPKLVPRVGNVEEQQKFIDTYHAILDGLQGNEAVVFADAVHPEYQAKPAYGRFHKDSRPKLRATSGRQRLNIHAALNPEAGHCSFIEESCISATSTKAMLERVETAHPDKRCIHVILDNARYHHARVLKPWLEDPNRRVKLIFLPAYCPHLNPIERLWAVLHRHVTHNRESNNFTEFIDAVLGFLKSVKSNWNSFRDQVTDNFRTICACSVAESSETNSVT